MSSFSYTFRAFRSHNYQLFFWGQLISRIGMWMQRTAVIWLVYSMTQSVFMVGVATFAEQFPSFILSPLGGVFADRYNRFKILMTTQVVSAIQAIVLTTIYVVNYHEVWMILLLSMILGIANAFDVPARQPMVNDLVESKDDLPNAIAINSSVNNLARLIGPAMAGFVMAKYGAGICFGSNAVSFVAVIISLHFIKLPKQIVDRSQKMAGNFKAGVRYVRDTPEIGYTLLLLLIISLLVASYNTLLPVFAKEIFQGDAKTFGLVNASIGVGAFASTIYIASLRPNIKMKKVLFINLLLLSIGLICLSYNSSIYAGLFLLLICGFGTMSIFPICNTIIQLASIAGMRGRVISLFAMAAFGGLPLGSLFISWLSEIIGVQNCVLLQGFIGIIVTLSFSKFLLDKQKNANLLIPKDSPE